MIYLFDVDGAQLGLKIWPSISPTFVDIVSVLGNTAWLLGVFFLVGGIGVIWMQLEDGPAKVTEVIKVTMKKQKKSLSEISKGSPFATLINTIGIFVQIVGIGSGFWFTASSALLLEGGSLIFMSSVRKRAKEMAIEGGEVQAPDILNNPLDR